MPSPFDYTKLGLYQRLGMREMTDNPASLSR